MYVYCLDIQSGPKDPSGISCCQIEKLIICRTDLFAFFDSVRYGATKSVVRYNIYIYILYRTTDFVAPYLTESKNANKSVRQIISFSIWQHEIPEGSLGPL